MESLDNWASQLEKLQAAVNKSGNQNVKAVLYEFFSAFMQLSSNRMWQQKLLAKTSKIINAGCSPILEVSSFCLQYSPKPEKAYMRT